jgi:peptide/nickel transport system substrate-binding protein
VPSSSAPRQRAAVLLQEQFKRVGVDLRIEQLDFNALIARLNNRNFDAVMNASHADPSPATIRQSWTTAAARAEGGSNYGSFENARFDAYVDSAVASRNVDESRRLYKAAYQAFVDEVPVILLYEPKLVAGVHRRVRVAGMRPDAWWAGIGEWSIPAAERIERDRIGLRPAAQ